MNKLIICGNLTRDPETRSMQDGTTMCSFTLAVNRSTRKPGEEPQFFRVTTYSKLAENCGKWLAKGRKVIAVGELTLREYAGRDGQMRASLDVRANEVEFLTSPSDPPKTARQEPVDDYATLTSEDIPF